MTKEQQEKVLASLYDRLLDAVTYSPDGKSASFKKEDVYFQMDKNRVIDPADFDSMVAPTNPNGDLKASAAFSAMVDAVPATGALWSDSGNKVSEVFKTIVANANTDSAIDPAQKKIYQQAYDFLNVEIETKDFKGNVSKRTDPSDTVIQYDDAQAAYIAAVTGYRTAYNDYNLDLTADQRQWNAVAPGLQNNLTQAWNKWVRAGKAQVEEAQNALASTINDAVRYAIAEGQRLVNSEHQLAPIESGGNPWLLSYALPSSWAQASSKASKLSFKSSYLNKTESSSAHQYAVEAKAQYGLWHASGGVSGSHEEKNAHMDAQNFGLEAELIAVTIKRPWLNPLLLNMTNWWLTGINKDGISNGDRSKLAGMMPIIPTGFVVARNVKITADFSEEDKKFVSNAVSTKAEGGWGPFSISGSYSYGSTKSDFQSKLDSGALHLPGLQLIAWVSAITPASPPLAAAPSRAAAS